MHDSHTVPHIIVSYSMLPDQTACTACDRLMCSGRPQQGSASGASTCIQNECKSTMDINGYTSRGPLHAMVVHAVVQWLPSLCRVCALTENDRQINLSQRVLSTARVVRGRYLPLSRPRDSWGFKESSSASETDSACTIADEVAEGRLTAGFITIV